MPHPAPRGSAATLRGRHRDIVAFSGASVLQTDLDGWIDGTGTRGLHVDATRTLRRDELEIDGEPLVVFAAATAGAERLLCYAYATPGPAKPNEGVQLAVDRLLDRGLRTTVRLHHRDRHRSRTLELAWHLSADFADLTELEDGRAIPDPVSGSWDAEGRVLRFEAAEPRLPRALEVRVLEAPGAVSWEDGALRITVEMAPRTDLRLVVEAVPLFDDAKPRVDDRALRRLRATLHEEAPRLESDDAALTEAWSTAVQDLAAFPLGLAEGPGAPGAGVPIYSHLFGRDTLSVAAQVATILPTLSRDALDLNASRQATGTDPWRDEQPGRLLHQERPGPASVLGENPLGRYYGDYTAPLDYSLALAELWSWTGDRALLERNLPVALRALAWARRDGDLDGDGFLEYETQSQDGVPNQGWKDSDEAIVDEDGETVRAPIAASDVQAYWFQAQRAAAAMCVVTGRFRTARALLRESAALAERFQRAFWMQDEGFYGLALGSDKRLIRTISSNPAHLLGTGIVPGHLAGRVARRLMSDDLFSGWGIRTLSSDHPAYDPFSYHLGSVWPVENGAALQGLSRYGQRPELARLARGLIDLTACYAVHRMPEAVGGVPRDDDHPHPGVFPTACDPQAWSAGAVVMAVRSVLGLRAVAATRTLVVGPYLPEGVDAIRLTGLRVADAVVDLDVRRGKSGRAKVAHTVRRGTLRVVRQPPPDEPGAGVRARAFEALRGG